MLCPVCRYMMDPFEEKCPRCAREEETIIEQIVQPNEELDPQDATYNLSDFDEKQAVILPPPPETEPASIAVVFPLNTLELRSDETPSIEQIENSCAQIVQPNEDEDDETLIDLSNFNESQALQPGETLSADKATPPSPQQSSSKHEHILAAQNLADGPSHLDAIFSQVVQTDEVPPGDDVVDLSNFEADTDKP